MKEVLTGVGSIQQGMAANSAGKYTKKVMKINAKSARGDALEARDRIRTEARRTMGRQIVAQGGSGFAIGTGSALDDLFESAIEREIDIATVRRQGEMKALGFQQQGDLARAQGKSAMIGGLISGAASFVEAGEKAYTSFTGGGAG